MQLARKSHRCRCQYAKASCPLYRLAASRRQLQLAHAQLRATGRPAAHLHIRLVDFSNRFGQFSVSIQLSDLEGTFDEVPLLCIYADALGTTNQTLH